MQSQILSVTTVTVFNVSLSEHLELKAGGMSKGKRLTHQP